jgi:hypothetical protein
MHCVSQRTMQWGRHFCVLLCASIRAERTWFECRRRSPGRSPQFPGTLRTNGRFDDGHPQRPLRVVDLVMDAKNDRVNPIGWSSHEERMGMRAVYWRAGTMAASSRVVWTS